MTETTSEPVQDLTKEIGGPVGLAPNPMRLWGPSHSTHVVEPLEPNPELRFPASVEAYGRMARTDGKIGSILRAIKLQIRKAPWALLGEGVRPEVLAFVEKNIALDKVKGRERARHKGIVFDEHLRELLSCMHIGFSAFEPVYTIVRARTEDELALGTPYLAYLRKLAERDPSTIEDINLDEDGGLAGITQRVQLKDGAEERRFIPVAQLLMYVNDKHGADWTGVSILREAYKDWYMKDNLERVNAQGIERNSMGYPIVYFDPTVMTEDQALGLATNIRAGAAAGAAVPGVATAKVELLGVSGATKDALPSIQHHDQAISRAVLAMFLDLGHDGGLGSAGIGNTYVDVFNSSIEAIANEVAETFTEHVIRDLVELNFGPEEAYPVLSAGAVSASRNIDPNVLKILIDAGVVKPTAKDEAFFRTNYGLPEYDEALEVRTPAPAAPLSTPVSEAVDKGAVVEEPVETALAEPDHLARANALLEAVNASRASRHV